MILLLSGRHSEGIENLMPQLGYLMTPRIGNRVQGFVSSGRLWAADNDAYSGFNENAYRKMLDNIAGMPRLLWVTAPDVVADATATLKQYEQWQPCLDDMGFPVAFVAQDGLRDTDVPWDNLDCLFVGGSTEYKLGVDAARLVKNAKQRNKWVHMGRVNSNRRIRYAQALGCDSIDGSSYSRFRETLIPGAIKCLTNEQLAMTEFFL